MGRVENRKEVWAEKKSARRFGSRRVPYYQTLLHFFFDSTQTFCHSLRRYHRALNFTSTHGFLTEHLEQAIFLFTDTKTYHRGRLQN